MDGELLEMRVTSVEDDENQMDSCRECDWSDDRTIASMTLMCMHIYLAAMIVAFYLCRESIPASHSVLTFLSVMIVSLMALVYLAALSVLLYYELAKCGFALCHYMFFLTSMLISFWGVLVMNAHIYTRTPHMRCSLLRDDWGIVAVIFAVMSVATFIVTLVVFINNHAFGSEMGMNLFFLFVGAILVFWLKSFQSCWPVRVSTIRTSSKSPTIEEEGNVESNPEEGIREPSIRSDQPHQQQKLEASASESDSRPPGVHPDSIFENDTFDESSDD